MATRENGIFPGHLAPGGVPGHVAARHAVRIGDVERDAAAHELGEHFVAGRLTLEELHERLGLVLSARTRGQLVRVMADLPTFRRARPPAPAPPVPALATGMGQDEQADGGSAARLAAVGLLLVAMLIWLLTVLLFTRHGYYAPYHHYQPSPWHQ
jgi:hypothetical protein